MQALGILVASLAELAEAEGRLLRRSVMRTARAIVWMFVAALIASAGATLVLYGVYLEGAALGRPSVGAFLAGGAAMLVAAFITVKCCREPSAR
jgi:hypothetical protein